MPEVVRRRVVKSQMAASELVRSERDGGPLLNVDEVMEAVKLLQAQKA